jgi:hypothetical protein
VGARTISFNTINGNQSALVRVGSCPQWKGYAGGPLYLDVAPEPGRLAVELIE